LKALPIGGIVLIVFGLGESQSMKTLRVLLLSAIVLFATRLCFSQPVIWSGTGDGTSWSQAQNWVGLQVPGPANSVFITNAAGGTVTISSAVTVESILCSNALTISSGSLSVTNGASLLLGTLTVSSGAALFASGSGTTLTSGGSLMADGANFYVSAGAMVNLPGLQSYDGGCDIFTWTVAGPGSVLNLAGLTNMTQPNCGSGGHIEAQGGGQILAANLANITQDGDPQSVQADGTNSLVNFSDLKTVSGAYLVTFEASAGGTNWVPAFVGGSNASVTLNPGGILPIAQMEQLRGITATAVTNSFPSLTNFDGGNVSLIGGAVVTLPELQNYDGECNHITWMVAGPNSVLNLPTLTNITQPYCGLGGFIEAEAGGQILAPNLANISQGGDPQSVQADGTNSLVNFSSLETVSGAYPITFEASADGTNWVPHLIGGTNANVVLNPGSVLPVAQIQQLAGITASNVTVDFTSLTSFDGGNISLSGGAVVTLADLQNYSGACGRFTWTVVGPNTVLNLPVLTNMTQPYCGHGGQIEAASGGQILAGVLLSIDAEGSGETVQADGINSLVDLSGLEIVSGTYTITFEASDGGTNWVPNLIGGTNAYVSLNPGGALPVVQLRQLGGITATEGDITFASLTNFDGGNVSLSGGAMVTLPALQNYSGGCGLFTWTVTGANSVLNLPELTNMSGPYCGHGGYIEAEAGGQIWATNLLSFSQEGDPESVQADGTNSLVDFSNLVTDSGAFAVTFEASGGATNWVPHFLGGSNVYLTLNAGGTLPVTQMTQLRGIADSNVTANFTALSNIDGGSITVNGGVVVTLPALENYSTANNGSTWQAVNSGSVLSLPALTNLLGSYCCPFNIEGLSGGQLLLSNLANIQDGTVSVLSDGIGSVINLSQLSRFVISTGQGQITAQNSGTILFNDQAFLLANVAINIPAGNPILPPTLIASSALTLCGTAWDSYRVEERNTLVPGSAATVLLVPLTNTFQAIALAPPRNTAFLITEFVANPPILQMGLTADGQVQLVLFGLTNATYNVQSTTNLHFPIPWTPAGQAVMTNSFRIFPETPPAAVVQFYRAEQQ
jgi:hypothetical protein